MSSNKRISIIHFQPLEAYPPVMNVLQLLPAQMPDYKWQVFTSQKSIGLKLFLGDGVNLRINRLITQERSLGRLSRLLRYFTFNLSAIIKLLRFRPGQIIYFETISAFPAIFYKWLFPKTRVYIHYHEYTSQEEQVNGMVLTRLIHKSEKWLYPRAQWISHTNSRRMQLFLEDEHLVASDLSTRIMPNYPPEAWLKMRQAKTETVRPVKLVYVGSLGFNSTYIREVCEWVQRSDGRYSLDIYSYQMEEEVRRYIGEIGGQAIKLHRPINYTEIPKVLPEYDIGLILYKGHIPNYIHNAPNKLFEYHICGLSIWYPEEMEGCHSVDPTDFGPPIICVNFKKLDQMAPVMPNKKKLSVAYNNYPYTCQKSLTPIMEALIKGAL
ncbi:MAG: hypothetical protein KDC34_03775 [Saprospiraceae bacterium]|nr:hypothetical protein [Saprospiraceae bacterium]